jgi:hypothetical protein
MPRWLISVPVWGERCVEIFCGTTLPALEKAMLRLPIESHLVVHTDSPRRIADGATEINVEARPVPAGARDFDSLSQAHREVLGMACNEDRVALLTADLLISEQGLEICEEILDGPGKNLVVCCGIRALQEGRLPDTHDAASMMQWAWANAHPMTQASTYPDGLSSDLSRLYFEDHGHIIARLALPHPLAVKMDSRPLPFSPTVDANLIQNFNASDTHVIIDSNRLALVELSPRDKDFQTTSGTVRERLLSGEFVIGDPAQRWMAKHRISLCGTGALPSPGRDDRVMMEVLKDDENTSGGWG